MKIWIGAAIAALLSIVQSDRAWAQSEPDRLLRLNRGFGDANYYFCFAQSREASYGIQVFTEVVSTDARVTLYEMLSGVDAATNPLPGRPWSSVSCREDSGGGSNTFQTRQAAEDYRQSFMAASRQNGMTIVEIPWPGKLGRFDKGQASAVKSLPTEKGLSPSREAERSTKLATPTTPAPSKYVEMTGPDGKTIHLSPEVAARNQAAADEYRRKMDEHARAKAEHEQRLAQHRQNAATAASAEEQHKREVAAAAERYAAYQVAMADHARKVAGASTNDDPNTCITRPEFRSNDGFPGNTSASVINGCPQKVDIVLCLKRTAGDWTCGAKFGVLTQGKMTYSTREATGEIFVDAITYGGGGKLRRPEGM